LPGQIYSPTMVFFIVVLHNKSETVFGKLRFYNFISTINNSSQILNQIVKNKTGFVLFHWSHFDTTLFHVPKCQAGGGTCG